MDTKKNIPLIVGLLIPVLMILFVAASIYLPGLFVQPKVSFIFSYGGDYYSRSQYDILNGRITLKSANYPKKESNQWSEPRRESKLYLYDVIRNKSVEISLEEAQKFFLDPSVKSPDGFEITRGEHGFSIFEILTTHGGRWDSSFITGHNVSKRLNLPYKDRYYSRYLDFIGWIIE
ncbi:MAG TPA: hypothetical protein PL155_01635 [Candidatus Omnitrophota bacterium]|nr:hypothetical protein [Candidatus Omnitrophota bacterium]HPD84812.1 hypothetical protein [Candidatus Omnitrophota bacterium]HRZ03670.1 hypothetical protein [Candidatus Omnitrophota bacterium]